MAATASPNLADQQLLATDVTFKARVIEAMISTCFNIGSEAISSTMPLSLHLKRAAYAVQTLSAILNNPTLYSAFFASCVATDPTTIGAATAAGATPLTSGNVAAQAAQIPDVDIVNALSAQFNSFFSP
jgi:hypothetical protein